MCLHRAQIIKFFILELLQIHNSCTEHKWYTTALRAPHTMSNVANSLSYACVCTLFRTTVWAVYDSLFVHRSLVLRDRRRRRTTQTEYFRKCRTILLCVCDCLFLLLLLLLCLFENAYFILYVRNARGNNMFMMHFSINVECELAISSDSDHRLRARALARAPSMFVHRRPYYRRHSSDLYGMQRPQTKWLKIKSQKWRRAVV